MSSKGKDKHLGIAPCTGLPLAPGEHPGLVPTEAWWSSPSYGPLFGYGGLYGYKQAHEGASSCGCSFSGPQTASGAREWGPYWCQPGWVSAGGERFACSDVVPAITKATLPIAREKKVLPASWAPAQPAAAICLASMTSQHTETCSWAPSVLQRGWPGCRARPPHTLPGALRKAALHPPA